MADDDKTRIGSDEGVLKGTQLNGIYEIDERIASGGMGEVYRGHNIQTDDPVAIKIVLPEFARDQNILALFRKEASVLNHLAHDAIVRYHVFSMDPLIGRPYLAMEFVDGQSLAEHIQNGPLPPQDARKMIARIASGLALAHGAGIIHRDLSPDNIILPGGKVERSKLIDFGIAKSATVGGGTLLGGKFAGKYNFVSPEQLGLFGGEVTERSDVYSLGLVLAAALRGEALDMSGSQVEVIEKRRALPDLTGIDPGLRPLVEAMLQPDPRSRIGSAADVVTWLQQTENRSVPPGQAPGYQPTQIAPGFPGQGAPGLSVPPSYTTPPATSQHPYGSHQGASQPPAYGAQPPLQNSQHPFQGSQHPFQGSQHPFQGSQPPPPQGSYPYHPSQPPHYGSQPPGSQPPFTGSVNPYGAPQGSHPGQPGVLPPHAQQPRQGLPVGSGQGAPARQKRSSAPLYALLAVVVILAGAGGAYYSGALNGIIGGTPKPPETSPTLTPSNQGGGQTAAGQGTSNSGTSGSPTETAQNPPPATPKAKLTGEDWLRSYDAGPCVFAKVTSISGQSVEMEGFGASVEPFEKMAQAYKADSGVEPNIGVHQVDQRQCAIVDFLQGIRTMATNNPALALSRDLLKVGDVLSGTISKVGDRTVYLYLVTNEGVVYSLDALWKQRKTTGDSSVFGMKLFPTTDEPMTKPHPHLIVAIASTKPIKAAEISDPVLASALFPLIGNDVKSAGGEVGATVGYFMFGG